MRDIFAVGELRQINVARHPNRAPRATGWFCATPRHRESCSLLTRVWPNVVAACLSAEPSRGFCGRCWPPLVYLFICGCLKPTLASPIAVLMSSNNRCPTRYRPNA